METEPKIDLMFSLQGKRVPVDHGYALYSALSRILDTPKDRWWHDGTDIGLHLIRGRYLGNGILALGRQPRFGLRLPASLIPKALAASGKGVELDGHGLRIGVPQTFALVPATALYAHCVTTRNGQEEERFDAEMRRQLDTLAIRGKATRGKRRTLRVRDKTVVAHSLLVTELTAEESIRLQEAGMGGRRKMGCGVFLPWKG